MGHNWHTILPFLVAFQCFAAVQDVKIVGVLTSESLNVYDYTIDEHLISLSGFDGSATGNLNWKLTQVQNLVQGIFYAVEGFEDCFTHTSRKNWLNVHDEDSKTNIIAAINKSIVTNQFYLSEILSELGDYILYVTNQIPFSILNSPYLTDDPQGNPFVDTNSVSFAFSERLVSNNLSTVSSDYSGPSNAVWDVGEDTEVGYHFSSMFSVTNLLPSLNDKFDELIDNINESPNTLIESFTSLKGGSSVFVIDYHPNFWIQGMTEAPTQTITLNAEDVLSPDVVNIIQFVRTFALFGGSLILGVTTFFHIMKENPLWFN